VDFIDLPILCSQVDVDDMVLMEIWWGGRVNVVEPHSATLPAHRAYDSGKVTVLSFSV
jgi:hypothetical protein